MAFCARGETAAQVAVEPPSLLLLLLLLLLLALTGNPAGPVLSADCERREGWLLASSSGHWRALRHIPPFLDLGDVAVEATAVPTASQLEICRAGTGAFGRQRCSTVLVSVSAATITTAAPGGLLRTMAG